MAIEDPPTLPTRVEKDTPCIKCKYNLRGLDTNSRCPECGTPIAATVLRGMRKGLRNIGMDAAPASWVWLLSAALLVMVLSLLVDIASGVASFGGNRVVANVLAVLGEAMWLAGALVALRPRPEIVPGFGGWSEWKQLRLWAAGLIFAGTCETVLSAVFAAAGWSNIATSGLLTVLSMGSSVGLVLLAIYLGELADWSRDTDLGGKFRSTGWLIGAGTFLWALALPTRGILAFTGLATLANYFAFIILLVSYALLFYFLLRLALSCRWVRKNAQHAYERDLRRAERMKREQERKQAVESGARTPTPGEITEALYCDSCGYDLRGLRYGGVCPECGEAIPGVAIDSPDFSGPPIPTPIDDQSEEPEYAEDGSIRIEPDAEEPSREPGTGSDGNRFSDARDGGPHETDNADNVYTLEDDDPDSTRR